MPMSPEARLAELVAGENPLVVGRMRSGFVVMGDSQFLPGYVLLLAFPQVSKLNDLSGPERAQFLSDMALVGDAQLATLPAIRSNYVILGNLDPFLHAHIWPRYTDEPEAHRSLPPLVIPADYRGAPEHQFDRIRHGAIQASLHDWLRQNDGLIDA